MIIAAGTQSLHMEEADQVLLILTFRSLWLVEVGD
jgi:hypothetical protein